MTFNFDRRYTEEQLRGMLKHETAVAAARGLKTVGKNGTVTLNELLVWCEDHYLADIKVFLAKNSKGVLTDVEKVQTFTALIGRLTMWLQVYAELWCRRNEGG